MIRLIVIVVVTIVAAAVGAVAAVVVAGANLATVITGSTVVCTTIMDGVDLVAVNAAVAVAVRIAGLIVDAVRVAVVVVAQRLLLLLLAQLQLSKCARKFNQHKYNKCS